MQASATQQSKLRPRHAALLTAAAPLILASTAWSQLPAAAPTAAPIQKASAPQSLPQAQPTQIQPTAPVATAALPAPHAYRARVEFANNQLSIAAENSSLNEILNEIAKKTGMKITGGVTDERVYGSYGPDTPEVVLDQLLDGTGTNVMLLETPRHTLAELVLTPRNGGPTPPSPNAARADDRNEENLPPSLGGRRRDFLLEGHRGRPDNPSMENRPSEQFAPNQLAPTPKQASPTTPTAETSTPPPDASQQSPNGVKTPQQIYDDLVRQQAQQDQQQQAPTTLPQ